MGTANFFDKALLSVGQALAGSDPGLLMRRLDAVTVGIVFDDAASDSAEGQATLDLATRILARLYPRLGIFGQGVRASKHARQLRSLSRLINPAIEHAASSDEISLPLVVGDTSLEREAVYVGSDGWQARVCTDQPQNSGSTCLPFGAGAAACLGAANIFRWVFKDELGGAPLDSEVSLSILTYEEGFDGRALSEIDRIDIGEAHLVGLGAIGNGALWALARSPFLEGRLYGVDPEQIELSNLQRYVLAVQADLNLPKTQLAKKALKGSPLDFEPKNMSWADYLTLRNDWNLERVLVALDSARDRIAVQASLPKWIANSWTQIGDLGVSRHNFLGQGACLACLYLPDRTAPNQDEVIAQSVGMPEPELRMAIRELLHRGTPVGPEFIMDVAARLKIDPDSLMPYHHLPLSAFYAEAICGGIVFRASEGTVSGTADVPLAFQSAMAGIMLAAELVAEAGGLRARSIPTKTIVNLLKPLGTRLSYPVAKGRPTLGIRCICEDEDYRIAFNRKYAAP